MTRMAGIPSVVNFLSDGPNYGEVGAQSIMESAQTDATSIENESKIVRAEDRAAAQIEAGEVWADGYSAQASNQASANMFGSIIGGIGSVVGAGIESGWGSGGSGGGANFGMQFGQAPARGGTPWGSF